MFQESVIDRPLTGRKNLAVHARLWGVLRGVASTRIDEVVAAFGLAELIDRPVSTYSGGQRRRLEIARALLSEPKVLFLDEPTVGLDPRFRHELLDLIAGLREQEGMTILLTTHYLDEAEQLCDRVAIVHEGRIVALDTPAALLAGIGREIVELRVAGDVAARSRRCARAVLPATTRSRSARACSYRFTAGPARRPLQTSPTWGWPRPRSPAARRPSTTFTSNSRAHRWPRESDPQRSLPMTALAEPVTVPVEPVAAPAARAPARPRRL